jgi:hypothetical protein
MATTRKQPILGIEYESVKASFEAGEAAEFFAWLEKVSQRFKVMVYVSRGESRAQALSAFTHAASSYYQGASSRESAWQDVIFTSREPVLGFSGDWHQFDDAFFALKPLYPNAS